MATTAAQAAERAENAALPPGFHAESKIQAVKLDDLHVDRSYQRDLSMPLVEIIRNNWDEVASELILVSDRGDDGLFIVNGQHRTAAARMGGMTKIWARVVQGLNPAQEAALRLKTNVRMSDRPLERFRAQIAAGDPESHAIVKILARFDTEVNMTPSPEEGINAISTVEALYRLDDGGTLAEALQFIKDTFGMVGGKYATASFLRSIAWFILKHADEANFERAQSNLKGMGPAAFDRHARTVAATMGGSLWMNYYRSLVELYNEGLGEKSRLEWRLRGATQGTVRRSRMSTGVSG
jgi:uncharacterized protein DUF6551